MTTDYSCHGCESFEREDRRRAFGKCTNEEANKVFEREPNDRRHRGSSCGFHSEAAKI